MLVLTFRKVFTNRTFETLRAAQGATLSRALGTLRGFLDLAKDASKFSFSLHVVKGPQTGGSLPPVNLAYDDTLHDSRSRREYPTCDDSDTMNIVFQA